MIINKNLECCEMFCNKFNRNIAILLGLAVGIIVGFVISPIKKGIAIGSYNGNYNGDKTKADKSLKTLEKMH